MPPYLLVVESDPELAQQIGATLREANYEIAAEAEAAWAKRSLLVRAPDGIILDTTLSDASGFAVADQIRRDPDTAKVPIFFVASRFRGAAHQAEARRRFAPAEYLAAPIDVDSLLAMVLEIVPPSSGGPVSIPDYPSGPLIDPAQREEKRNVERAVRKLSTEANELAGSLAQESFARLLQKIFSGRLTGALVLARADTKKIVYFDEGYPVSVRSNVLSECLGQILLGHNMITAEALDESLRRMRAEKKHQGEVLVEMGALSPYNLSRALLAQMEAKFYEVFSWRTGKYAFKKGRTPRETQVRLDRPTGALILEGVRRHYDQERLRLVLDPLSGRRLGPSPDPLRRHQDITSDAAERQFIESIDGRATIESILASAPIPLPRARVLLAAMYEAGMIEPVGPAKSVKVRAAAQVVSMIPARASAKRAQPSRPPPPPPPHPIDLGPRRPPEQRPREELAATFEGMRSQNHFEVLGLDRVAGVADVDRAYQALARDYHPDRFRFHPDEVRNLAFRIFQLLTDAHAVLRDPGRRKSYVAELERDSDAPREIGSGLLFIKRSPGPAAEQVYFKGVEHLRSRRYREAAQAFRQAATLAPGQASYRGALGWALFRQAPGDPAAIASGLAELQRAVDMEPNDPWVRTSLGRFYAETGRTDEAIAEFEATLKLNPGQADVEEELRRLKGTT